MQSINDYYLSLISDCCHHLQNDAGQVLQFNEKQLFWSSALFELQWSWNLIWAAFVILCATNQGQPFPFI